MRKFFVYGLVIVLCLTSCWDGQNAESGNPTSLSSEETEISEELSSVTTESTSVESSVSESDSIEVEEFNCVNRVLQDAYTSDEYQEMSNEDRVNFYLNLLHDIAVNGIEPYNYPLIEEDSIVYIEEDNEIHFYYRSGLPGCVVIDYSEYEDDL